VPNRHRETFSRLVLEDDLLPPFQLVQLPKSPSPLPAAPADPALEALRAERAAVAGELTKLQGAAARLRETANAETAALDAVAAFTRSEADELTAWATDGAIGEAPRSDQDQRLRLGLALSEARSARRAAEIAGTEIDHQQREAAERLFAIDRQLEQAILDMLQTEHGAIVLEYRVAAEHARALAARIHGLCHWLGEEGRRLTATNNQAGSQYLTRASALTDIKLTDPGVNRMEIATAADGWGRRAATLRSGGV
jgi:hypothetical protein